MSFYRLSTLGAHPLVLLKKLESIGAVTILTEEKYTYNDVDYYYHIIAKLPGSMYIEILDPIYKNASTSNLLPRRGITDHAFSTVSSSISILKQEVLEANKTEAAWGQSALSTEVGQYIYVNTTNDIVCEAACISFLLRSTALAYYIPWVTSDVSLTNRYESLTEEVSGLSISQQSSALIVSRQIGSSYLHGTGRTSSVTTTNAFIVVGHSTQAAPTFQAYTIDAITNTRLMVFAVFGNSGTNPLIFSSSVARVATSVDEDNKLVNPSNWKGVPISSKVYCGDTSILFLNGPSAAYSSAVMFSLTDTSLGNNMPGTFPTFYQFFNANSGVSPQETIEILGMDNSASLSGTFSVYTPTPPINNDSYTGGPIASRVYAYSTTEIRGAIKGILSVPSTTALNTVGWIDTVRYSVLVPSRMFQIG